MMRLDVHMTPRQHRDGFADRIALLLFKGTFRAMQGRWRARRQLVVYDCRPCRKQLALRQVTFDLEPLDDIADAVVAQQQVR
jgi:hypothetical protein